MKTKDEMSFLDHVEVLRWHLIRSFCAIIFFSFISFVFKAFIFDSILLAPRNPDFVTYKILCSISQAFGFGDFLCLKESPFSVLNLSMAGQFSTHLTVSIFSGFIISFPYIFWEFWRFIKPALYENEVKSARGIVFFSSLLFFLGVFFGYYVVSPLSINFLGSYQVSEIVSNQISLVSYINTVTTVCLANGIIFELPILVYFLTKIGIVSPIFLKKYRRHALILTLILSAIITPPDITSQVLVSFPLIILYEISIKIAANIYKKQS